MRQKMSLTVEDARKMHDASLAEAMAHGWKVCIAIVDEGGYLLLAQRMDGAGLLTPETAIGKARTAAFFRGSTKTLEDRLAERPGLQSLPQYILLQGGLAILANGECLGGIGVSGVQSEFDDQIAAAGLAALGIE